MKNRFRKQNFSLLEMLVVIAIIAVLALMLMPGLNSAKEIAKRNQCLSRVRAISQLANMYSIQNDGLVPLYGPHTPPGKIKKEGSNAYENFSTRIAQSLMPETHTVSNTGEISWRYNESWWMFVCTNVLPYWSAGGPGCSNIGGYKKGQINDKLEEVWQKIKPGVQGNTSKIAWMVGTVAGGTAELAAFGNFGSNQNGAEYYKENKVPLSQIKSPSKRAFIAEEGESQGQANGDHTLKYVDYSTQISGGHYGKFDVTGYIPGMGGGGVGREKMESIGFDETISETQLDEERLELVKRDVMEGRHAGATLHGFFDGHAEVLSAETVGNLQLGPGDTKEDLRGPYGTITDAADDDEK